MAAAESHRRTSSVAIEGDVVRLGRRRGVAQAGKGRESRAAPYIDKQFLLDCFDFIRTIIPGPLRRRRTAAPAAPLWRGVRRWGRGVPTLPLGGPPRRPPCCLCRLSSDSPPSPTAYLPPVGPAGRGGWRPPRCLLWPPALLLRLLCCSRLCTCFGAQIARPSNQCHARPGSTAARARKAGPRCRRV